ncbi:MAG: DUF3426 domain-containing protein [Gallionella sp.]|nr:DUF3426 domain-containing protein [Gallionella sp.]
MLGTSICPNCDATFNIDEAQLVAAQGMVRCGRCLEVFDFRISYIANQPDPQLELPISNEYAVEPGHPRDFSPDVETTESLAEARLREIFGENVLPKSHDDDIHANGLIDEIKHVLAEDHKDIETLVPVEFDYIETLLPAKHLKSDPSHSDKLPDITEGELVAAQGEHNELIDKPSFIWPWIVTVVLFILALLAQATYFFRVELAANFPTTKPILLDICRILGCDVSLPQNQNLMSIESSDLADAPQNHLILNALLRNHAAYPQAFPSLELTLTDSQDNPQARRIFKPADYLSPAESEATGLLSNHEVIIKLYLDTLDIKPSGYRLVLFYPQ